MYQTTTAALGDGGASSELVAGYAGNLRVHAETLEEVRSRLRGVRDISWESPAGRRFKEYLDERIRAVADAALLMREAAVSLDAYSAALRAAEATETVGQ